VIDPSYQLWSPRSDLNIAFFKTVIATLNTLGWPAVPFSTDSASWNSVFGDIGASELAFHGFFCVDMMEMIIVRLLDVISKVIPVFGSSSKVVSSFVI
jgi:hypothetical protein